MTTQEQINEHLLGGGYCPACDGRGGWDEYAGIGNWIVCPKCKGRKRLPSPSPQVAPQPGGEEYFAGLPEKYQNNTVSPSPQGDAGERLHDRYYSGYHDEAFDEALRVIEQMEAVRRQDLRDFNRLQGDLSRAQARCEELERSAEGYRASYLIAHGERAEAQATIERLEGLMEGIARLANTDPWRTFDGMIQDMGQIDDLARSALAQGRGE
jgi:hypothetical protein